MAHGAAGGRRSTAVWMAAVAAAVGMMGAGSQMAAGSTWVVPASLTDSWFDASAWTTGVPTSTDLTYITNGGAPTINSGAAVSGTLYLGASLSQSGGVNVGGTGQLNVTGTAYLGSGGYGWIQQTGGSVLAANLQFGGATSRSSGTYTLSDGMLQVASSETLGYGFGTTAQFNQSGGIHNVTGSGSTLTVAYGSSSVANYSLTGGQFSSYALQIGYGGTSVGSMTQTGGQNTTGYLTLAGGFMSTGSYALSGNAQLTAYYAEYVGFTGTGVITQSGGINRTGTAALYLGYSGAAQGTYNLSGNGQLLAGVEYIGYGSNASGIMTQTGGMNALGNASLYVGSPSGATGVYQLSGAGLLTAGAEYVGSTSTGTVSGMGLFQQSGGTNMADSVTVGGNGRYDLTGGAVQVRNTFAATGKVTIGDPANPAAAPSLSTATLNVGPTIGTAAGSLTLTSSATADVATALRVWPTGTLSVKSGTLTAPSLVNDGAVSVTGGSLTGPQGSLASITGTGGITVGAGATVKAGYVRQGTVNVAGTLQLKHSGQATTFSDLSISPGGTLMLADDLAAWNYTGATPAGVLRQYLKSGYNGGDWAGTGLSSTAAAGDVNRTLGVGYAEASDLAVTTWGGQTVDSTTIVMKIVPLGDANLDGTITSDDYVLLDRGLALGHSGWSDGDFNYDGVVDAADHLIIDRTYAIQQGTLPSPVFLAMRAAEFGDAYVAALVASVPEPSCLGVGAMLGAMLIRRRRQR